LIETTERFVGAWEKSPVSRVPPADLILVTDFDGTLADIVDDPSRARARMGALVALSELVRMLADVIVLSSRTPDQLENMLPISGIRLIGDSGMAIPRHAQKEALERFNAEAGRILQGIPGAWVEPKPASTAVHFRNTQMTAGEIRALLEPLLGGGRLSLAMGRKVVEVHAPRAGKGSALAALLPAEDPGGVVCFGDDENDRSMFDYVNSLDIPHASVGVWSPEAPAGLFEGCDLVVQGPDGVVALLEQIVEWARVRD
jgi:trehalose-phosphatase